MKLKYTSGLIFLFIIGLLIWSVFIEPSRLFQNDQDVKNWKGPKLKIAFFTDLHAGAPYIDLDYIEVLVARINSNHPDLILIGGDFFAGQVLGVKNLNVSKVIQILGKLKAPLGTYTVMGNHDWWKDPYEVREELSRNSIIILENQAQLLQSQGQKFWLVGLGDHFTDHSNADQAFADVADDTHPRIFLMHNPASLLEVKNNFALALAGHVHGGQVHFPFFGALVTFSDAPRSWSKGWVTTPYGQLYVSQGIGTGILPIRFNASPEFVIFNLNENSNF